MELVSIIMPVKNGIPYLKECLDSILRQTHDSWELLVVDDHSIDDSLKILLEYAASDDRINVYQNTGQGIIPALQCALKHTRGTFITRMDADDLMPPYRLHKMLEVLNESPDKTIVTGLVKYFPTESVSPGYIRYQQWINEINRSGTQWDNIYRECIVASPNWMMRTETLLAAGGFDGLIYPEDYHLTFRWYQHRFRIKCLNEVTLYWREHPDRVSRNSENYDQRAFFWLKINEFLAHDYRTDQLVLWGKNRKTQLTRKVLKTNEIPYIEMDYSDYKKIEMLRNPQVLIGVYPPANERIKIKQYLRSIGLEIGKDYWFL